MCVCVCFKDVDTKGNNLEEFNTDIIFLNKDSL